MSSPHLVSVGMVLSLALGIIIGLHLQTNSAPASAPPVWPPASHAQGAQPASPRGSGAQSFDLASLQRALTGVVEAEALAEFVYRNQASTERGSTPSPLIARFEAEWPCMWGELATGTLRTFTDPKTAPMFKDGWKVSTCFPSPFPVSAQRMPQFTCGLLFLTQPCVVYSLGSSGNMAFESNVMEIQPNCELHVFDRDSYGIDAWFPPEVRSRVKFHRFFISDRDDVSAVPPRRSLSSIMRELGHTHLDILKMDIEGAEISILKGSLPSIGQLQVEVHLNGLATAATDYPAIFTTLERCGLRLFHKEANARYDTNCVELAFVQRDWRPERKNYPCDQ